MTDDDRVLGEAEQVVRAAAKRAEDAFVRSHVMVGLPRQAARVLLGPHMLHPMGLELKQVPVDTAPVVGPPLLVVVCNPDVVDAPIRDEVSVMRWQGFGFVVLALLAAFSLWMGQGLVGGVVASGAVLQGLMAARAWSQWRHLRGFQRALREPHE